MDEKEQEKILQEKFLRQLGQRIRVVRKAKGYSSHEKFANEKDFERAQYGRYERGKNLKVSSLMRLLRALEITPADFFAEGFDPEIFFIANDEQ